MATAAAIVGLALMLLAGCGHGRSDATVSTPEAPATSVPVSSTDPVAAATNTPTANTPAVDPQQLAAVAAELGTVDSQLAGVTTDVDDATQAINTQEEDPTK